MHTFTYTFTSGGLSQQPQRLIDGARRGNSVLVTRRGQPWLLAVSVIGAQGVLVNAKRRGWLGEFGSSIDQLRTSGQRSSRCAVAQALAGAGEGGPKF